MKIRIGSRFTRWKVMSEAPRDRNGRRMFHCRCECGVERSVYAEGLAAGRSKSCGCLKVETCAKIMVAGRKPPDPNARYKRPEYGVWRAMRDRCNRPKNKNYADYGGRGIKVYPEWDSSFDAFFAHLGPRPTSKHSIDRIDNDGDYEPGNVQWAVRTQQVRNTRLARIVTFNGETLHLKEWASRFGIGYSALKYRLAHGWGFERAIKTPSQVSRDV